MGLLRTIFLTGLCAALSGCAPDGIRIGAGVRHAQGNYRLSSEERFIPLTRVEIYKKITEQVEANARLDYIAGRFGFESNKLNHDVHGDFENVGAGLRYYPFCENFSFDFGVEGFTVQADALGRFGPFRDELNDRVYGYGANVGTSVHVPLHENVSLFLSGGYNFTDNHSRRVSFDFDGVYGIVGLQIQWK